MVNYLVFFNRQHSSTSPNGLQSAICLMRDTILKNITVRLKNPDVRKKRNGGDNGASQVRSYTLRKIEV